MIMNWALTVDGEVRERNRSGKCRGVRRSVGPLLGVVPTTTRRFLRSFAASTSCACRRRCGGRVPATRGSRLRRVRLRERERESERETEREKERERDRERERESEDVPELRVYTPRLDHDRRSRGSGKLFFCPAGHLI